MSSKSSKQEAASLALLAKQGRRPESRLKGDAKELYESMTEEELQKLVANDDLNE